MGTIQVEPPIPLGLWLALAAGGAALLAWYAGARPAIISSRRWSAALGFTALGLLLVLGMLLNPISVSPVPQPEGKPLVTILADRSASMAVDDQPAGRSRF